MLLNQVFLVLNTANSVLAYIVIDFKIIKIFEDYIVYIAGSNFKVFFI